MKHFVLALFAATVLLIGGCGGGASETQEGVQTITFWHSFVSSTEPALKELIKRFEAENPTIRINAQYIPTGDAAPDTKVP